MVNKTVALIVAAGQGKRFGGKVSKQFYELDGRPILYYTLKKFQDCPRIDGIVLVVQESAVEAMRAAMVPWGMDKVWRVVAGGRERHHSVHNGLKVIPEDVGWIAIHDGVRPLVAQQHIIAVIEAAQRDGAAILGVFPKDTIKEIERNHVRTTLQRQRLIQVQTPQVFAREIIIKAYEQAFARQQFSTDDAALVERLGIPVSVVIGDHRNIKVTTTDDLIVLKAFLHAEE